MQAGRGSEHLDLHVGDPVHCRAAGLDNLMGYFMDENN